MKNKLARFFIFVVVAADVFCAATDESTIDKIKRNPGVYLSPQDVPIFYEGNPLEGLNSFAVIPPYSFQNQEVSKKIESVIEKELGSIGTIIKEKNEDITGFKSSSLLTIQIGRISKWEGGQLPISRVTLNIETPVVISKTNVKSLPRVWSINNFVDSPLDVKSEDKAIGPVQKLLREFVKNYKFANPDQTQPPLFYIYS